MTSENSDCTNAQADLSLPWSHKYYCTFCRAQAHINIILELLIKSVIINFHTPTGTEH